jgi:hypothetical protein
VNTPLVSVLIRSMDRYTLERAMRSAAQQQYANLEIVVVAACGGSHRRLSGTFEGRKVVFVASESALPRAAAANVALRAANGQLLNFLDDDDELLPAHLRVLSALLAERPHGALAFARQEVVDARGQRVAVFGLAGPPGEPFTRLALFEQACFGIHAALFRRELMESGAQFDESLDLCEDHDFWLQCAARTRFLPSNAITTRWHGFAGNSGGGWGDNWDEWGIQTASSRVRSKWRATRERYLDTPTGQLELAQRSLFQPDLRHTLAVTERVLAAIPESPSAMNFAALANHRTGNASRARELVAKALARCPGHPALLANAALFRREPE